MTVVTAVVADTVAVAVVLVDVELANVVATSVPAVVVEGLTTAKPVGVGALVA